MCNFLLVVCGYISAYYENMPKFVPIEPDQPVSLCVAYFLSISFFESLRFKVRFTGKSIGGTTVEWFWWLM